jgi:integrase
MNLLKQKIVMDGVGGEGWEKKYGIKTSHDFRDYFITHKLNSGVSVEDISQISRNSISTIEKHYLRLSVESQVRRQKELDKTRKVLPSR